MRPMITNGGPHPADKWAETTSDAICDLIEIREGSESKQAGIARRVKMELRITLFDIFNEHHDMVQGHEKEDLATRIKSHAQARGHCDKKINHAHHLTDTVARVEAALAATPFATHFAKPAVQEIIRTIIGQHTATVMHIERKWHQDRLEAAKGA